MYKKLFIFNGFVILFFILWNYLIRVRLPKEISTDLSNYVVYYYITMFSTAVILLLITILHVCNIHIFSSSKILKVIKQSLEALDVFLKEYTEILSNALQEKVFIFLFNNQKMIKYLYIICYIAPKFCITLCLCYDVFYLKNIYKNNKCFPLLVLPLIIKYLVYNFKKLYDIQYKNVNKRINISCYTLGNETFAELITLEFFIEQTIRINHLKLEQLFDCLITLDPKFVEEITQKYGDDDLVFDYKKALVKYKNLVEHLIKLRTVSYIYEDYQRIYDAKLNIILYLIAAICWGYTLFLCNLYGYPVRFFIPEEPFSGLFL